MVDLLKLFAAPSEAPTYVFNPIKDVEKIPTPVLQRLYQNTGDRYIAMHKGVVSGNKEEYENLGNAVEFFKNILKRRDNEIEAGLRSPETGIQAEAMKTYLTELSERIDNVCGTFQARLTPNLRKPTNVAKYMVHQSEDVFISSAAKEKSFIYKKQPTPSFPKFLADNAKFFRNKAESQLIQTKKYFAERILDGLETKGLSIDQIAKGLLESKLPDAESYIRYLKRVR